MLEYDQIDFSDGIDVNKTDSLHKCIICHCWYFLEISFEFHPEVYHGCHNLIQKAMSVNDVAVTSVRGNDCRIHFLYMSKDKATNFLKNAIFTEKSRIS